MRYYPQVIDEMEIVVKFYHHFIRVPNFMSDTFSSKYFHVLIIIIRRYSGLQAAVDTSEIIIIIIIIIP